MKLPTIAQKTKFAKERNIDITELLPRRTGRTTAIAFALFGLCYKEPDKWHDIKDHTGILRGDRLLLKHMQWMVRKLQFYSFKFDLVQNRIKLQMTEKLRMPDIYEEEE